MNQNLAVEPIRRLHEHRRHVNGLLLEACRDLSHDQLKQTHAIGQGSIWKTLLHLYAAEYVWLGTLEGDPQAILPGDAPDRLPGNQEGSGGVKDLAELAEKWGELEDRWETYLDQLTDDRLEDDVQRTSTSSGGGKTLAVKRYDILLHVCTHAQYTTAQLLNMLRHTGVESLPDPMLITLARRQHPANTELFG